MKEKVIIAVIVTYNRLELLKEAINSIRIQTYPIDKMIIVDNASTDGTRIYLEKQLEYDHRLIYIRLNQNTGGAGGFHIGIEKAYTLGAEYVWIMDDDAKAKNDALHHLIANASKIKISFLCSNIFGNDLLPLNLPEIDFRYSKNGYPNWTTYLDAGLVKIRTSTFVSVLISREAIKKVGLPLKEMFIWGDDGEYTFRLSNYGESYLVGKSIVTHQREQQGRLSIVKETRPERIKNYFYYYRNNFYINRKYKTRVQLITFVYKAFKDSLKMCLKGNLLKVITIYKGLLYGIFFKPKIINV